MRRRHVPSFIGDVVKLNERQERMERVMQIFGISPEYPYTINVNDGTRNTVQIGLVDGVYGIKIVDNAGNEILLANGTIVADAIKTGTLDCDLITVANLSAGDIVTGTLSANFISGGTLDFDNITANNIKANEITVGVFSSFNDRLSAQAIHGGKLQVGTLDADRISANTIDVDQIRAHIITTDQLSYRNVDGDYVLASQSVKNRAIYGDISATKIITGTLDAQLVNVANINANNINVGTLTGLIVQTHSSSVTGLKMMVDPYASVSHGYLVLWGDYGDAGLIYYHKSDAEFHFEGGKVNIHNSLNLHSQNIENVREIQSDSELILKSNGTDKISFESTFGGGDLSMYPYWGNFYASGTKYFKIPHPLYPEKKSIQYASVEAPEVALKIRGKTKLVNGEAIIILPEHWVLTTEEKLTTINLMPLGECNGLFTPKDRLTNERFEVKELGGGNSNAEFSWELTCTRKGYADFEPVEAIEEEAEMIVGGMLEDNEEAIIVRQKRKKLLEKTVKEKYKSKTGKILMSKESEERKTIIKRREDYIIEMVEKGVLDGN